MKLIMITTIFLSLSNLIKAQEPIKFENLLSKLNSIEVEKFTDAIVDIKKNFDSYFDNKSRICQGEFSTMVLGEEPREEVEPAKLSREEIKACLNNLMNERMVYIDSIYELRRKYLIYLHALQLEQLKKSKEDEVAQWQKLKTTK